MSGLWLRITALCGLAVLGYNLLAAKFAGGNAGATLTMIAAGPPGDAARDWAAGGVVLGLFVHFALTAAMIGGGLVLARLTILGEIAPWKAGTFYGLALYMAMYGLVLPWRFGVPFPNPDRLSLFIGLVPHVLLVGLPVFYMAKRKVLQANSADLRSS